MYHRPEEAFQAPAPLIPVVPQPRGAAFFLQTWTGRIILVNTLMFFITCWLSGRFDLFSSKLDILIHLGAKDSVRLAQGEYWRLFTPMFIHSGFIHYAFNNWALYVISYQMEFQLGSRLFLLLYLGSGLAGSIGSAVRSLTVSVGASGALFGLLGFGFYLERVVQSRIQALTGNRPKAGAYTGMVIANILFGFMIPQIDNAAHIGGLTFGVVFAYIWLRYIPNRLLPMRRVQGRIATALLLVLLVAGAWLGSSRWYVLYRLEGAIQSADQVQERYFYLNRLVELEPDDAQDRLHRLKIALQLRDYKNALDDLSFFQGAATYDIRLKEMESELDQEGFGDSAAWLRRSRQSIPLSL